jgi:predicted ATPase
MTYAVRRIREALAVAVPQLKMLEPYRDERGTPHLRGNYEHWQPQGAWQNENRFSDGTLRLVGLLWALLDGSGPLLLEEPELQLHSEVVKYLPQMFTRIQRGRQGRQIMLSTHSPELLRDGGIGLDEVLLLEPSNEGTHVRLLEEFKEVKDLLDVGIPLDEAILAPGLSMLMS